MKHDKSNNEEVEVGEDLEHVEDHDRKEGDEVVLGAFGEVVASVALTFVGFAGGDDSFTSVGNFVVRAVLIDDDVGVECVFVWWQHCFLIF